MIPDVVQPVSAPKAVSTLEQLVRGDVHLLVVPGVLLVLTHVVALLAGDGVVFLDLVAARTAVKIHLEQFFLLKKKTYKKSFKKVKSFPNNLQFLSIN
jgi:hypothetical protein